MKKTYLLVLVLFLFSKTLFAQEQYLGEIRLFAGNYAPRGWAKCEGQLLNINTNQALFVLLGVTYGGDGRTTFALPDYRGRAAVSPGNTIEQGDKVGTENTYLNVLNLPAHNHDASLKVSSAKATSNTATTNSSMASPTITVNSITRDILGYNDATANSPTTTYTSNYAGSSIPIPTMQPYLVMTYMIAIQGIFPSRP